MLLIFYALLVHLRLAHAQETHTLRLVHTITRHGAKTPSIAFPTDPNPPGTWPEGPDQLTKVGIQQMYQFGWYLRDRFMYQYSHLLNDTYINKQIFVRSSPFDRVINSAESAVAGLYPPKGSQVWNPELFWQPVPVHAYDSDPMLLSELDRQCSKTKQIFEEIMNSAKFKGFLKENQVFMDKVANLSGLTQIEMIQFISITNAIYTQRVDHKLQPSWVTEDIEEKMMAILYNFIDMFTESDAYIKLTIGLLITDILNHTDYKMTGRLEDSTRLFSYFTHDSVMVCLLKSMSVWNKSPVPFASSVFVELHEPSHNNYTIKIFYRNDTSQPPYLLDISGCGLECPFHRFREIVERFSFPTLDHYYLECEEESEPIRNIISVTVALSAVIVTVAVVVVLVCLFLRSKSKSRHGYHPLPVTENTKTS